MRRFAISILIVIASLVAVVPGANADGGGPKGGTLIWPGGHDPVPGD